MYDLLRAWGQVTKVLPNAGLRVIGHATRNNRSAFIERRHYLGLDTNVELVGVVSDEGKWAMLEESRVCLFLSHNEGWGYVPLEALSVGVPVVVYDLPCYSESLQGLEGVFRVSVGDTLAAGEQVIRLLTMVEGESTELSESIRASFRYPGWEPVASAEMALILGS